MTIFINIVMWILQYLHFASVHPMIHFDNLSILPTNIIFTNLFLTQIFFFKFHVNRILHFNAHCFLDLSLSWKRMNWNWVNGCIYWTIGNFSTKPNIYRNVGEHLWTDECVETHKPQTYKSFRSLPLSFYQKHRRCFSLS